MCFKLCFIRKQSIFLLKENSLKNWGRRLYDFAEFIR